MPTLYDNFSQVRQYIDENAGHVDLSAYVSKTELAGMSYVTTTALEGMGYLTSVPSEYITDAELSACGYLTEHQDLSAYATKTYVADYVATYAPTPDLSAYVTKTELSDASYATTSQIPVIDESLIPNTNNTYTLGNSSNYYKTAYVNKISLNPPAQSAKDKGVIVSGYSGLNITSTQIYIKFDGDGADTTYTYYVLNKDYCGPYSNKSIDFGNKKNRWNAFNCRAAYSYNMYLGWPETNIYDIFPTYDAISAMGYLTAVPSEYVTETELSGMSYATQTYVVDYVAEHGGGGGGGDVSLSDLVFRKNGNGAVSSLIGTSYTTPLGNRAITIGYQSYSAGENSISFGANSNALADNSVTIGRGCTTNGWSSAAMGRSNVTYNFGEVAVGCGNFSRSNSYTSPHAFTNLYPETMFSVGIGGTSVPVGKGINAIEVTSNGETFLYGAGGNTGKGDGYSLTYILNNMFSYNSSTGTLTITTF